MKIKGIAFFSFYLIAVTAFSQTTYHHNTAWFRLLINDKITEKLKWELMLQYRTQNTESGSLDIFKSPQLKSYWVWLNYQATKDLKISVMPLCQFATSPLISVVQSETRTVKEFRWAVRLENQQKYKHFQLLNRYILEYRMRDLFIENEYVHNWRARYMIRFVKPVKADWLKKKQLNLIVYDELHLQFGGAVKGFPNVFDQNRIYAGASYEFIKNVKLDLGYCYIIQERRTGKDFDAQNALWFVLTFENIFSQFKRAEK